MATMIKFRAWDNENGFYLYNIQDAYDTMGGFVKYDDGEDADYDEDCFGSFLDNKRYVVEQFTGLKDMNGKEIYVGDIVHAVREDNYDRTGKVIFDNGAYMVDNGRDRELLNPILGEFTVLSIVGDIHNNPELLEADK